MRYQNIEIAEKDNFIQTVGLQKSSIRREIVLELEPGHSKEGKFALVEYLIDYILKFSPSISHHQTLGFGIWMVRFVDYATDFFRVEEFDIHTESFTEKIGYSIDLWANQVEICYFYSSLHNPPSIDSFVVVSDGVMEGLPLEAVRYPDEHPGSGWWFTTESFDGNIESMKKVSMYDFLKRRLEMAPYLALDHGYCLKFGDEFEGAWREALE